MGPVFAPLLSQFLWDVTLWVMKIGNTSSVLTCCGQFLFQISALLLTIPLMWVGALKKPLLHGQANCGITSRKIQHPTDAEFCIPLRATLQFEGHEKENRSEDFGNNDESSFVGKYNYRVRWSLFKGNLKLKHPFIPNMVLSTTISLFQLDISRSFNKCSLY